ncbi:MAG: Excinuclease ABC subunit C [Candidatus Woesebacteria bacterium GW2011_GWB1_38_5b]|uniref:Excinuclease ABC subunit C n=1 Tax=Candidatus Woesebacteria bacterium GW2011_GWB1_38_5b TaxID=1618569 RepID=A0A0G0MLY0_9BACT|nr:MAG: Excinuclease ABC subunit C [Candidatus Woesebacteria bacterium GW2011_GWB1_38_5b]
MAEWPASRRQASESRRVGAGLKNKMYTVYILKSKNFPKTYVGHTNNKARRFLEHNEGRGTFSSRYKPWILIHEETFGSLKETIKREKYFKSAAGRRWIKKNLFS